MGKEVYVAPHEINSSSGKGSNKLLLEGAKIFLEPSQLILDIGCSINPTNLKENSLSSKSVNKEVKPIRPRVLTPSEERVVNSFKDKALTIEEISINANITQSELIELLSVMELEGKVKALGGGRYYF